VSEKEGATAEFRLERGALPGELVSALPAHLARQRWYAGSGPPPLVEVEESGCLAALEGGGRLLWASVAAGGDLYQLVLGERPGSDLTAAVSGRDRALVASAGGKTYYDATVDPQMAIALLLVASGGSERARTARPLGAEQSNTSVVYDDRVIVKIFRRLSQGPNSDVEVTSALARAGFCHVAAPVLRWRKGETDLAFGQKYLAGGTDGWALALTSLRDLYSPRDDDEDFTHPGLQGGDFAAEAARLGTVTAEMHLAMAAAFGTAKDWSAGWDKLRMSLEADVRELGEPVAAVQPLLQRLAAVSDLGPALRPHGDYHLGQVMRTDAGWYVLDFEGEPNRSLDERLAPVSAMKDVAGMLRSFDYAVHFAMAEHGPGEVALEPLGRAWEERNREAFMTGYLGTKGIDDLLPASVADRVAVCLAFEVEKALYELSYERAYRPAWEPIPLSALHKLLAPDQGRDGGEHTNEVIDLGERQPSGGRLG
jgi:maltokinase